MYGCNFHSAKRTCNILSNSKIKYVFNTNNILKREAKGMEPNTYIQIMRELMTKQRKGNSFIPSVQNPWIFHFMNLKTLTVSLNWITPFYEHTLRKLYLWVGLGFHCWSSKCHHLNGNGKYMSEVGIQRYRNKMGIVWCWRQKPLHRSLPCCGEELV